MYDYETDDYSRLRKSSLMDLVADAAKRSIEDFSARDPEFLDASRNIASCTSDDDRKARLMKWFARNQPCMFGRLAATNQKGVGIDIVWISEADVAKGDAHVEELIQKARRKWKDNARLGLYHGFLVFFYGREFSELVPSDRLVDIHLRLGDLYLPEARPVQVNTVYTEAVPLLHDDGLTYLYKGGINIFYTSAVSTANHDRRVPGGMMISTNSPGQYANSLVVRGLLPSLRDATERTLDLALRSVGNGGIGPAGNGSCTWHNRNRDDAVGPKAVTGRKKTPLHVPDDYDTDKFSGNYHTDILVPLYVTREASPSVADWKWEFVYFDFYKEDTLHFLDPNFGQWVGVPVPDESIYFNPWRPERPENRALDEVKYWSKVLPKIK
jgi:hypothetical protein